MSDLPDCCGTCNLPYGTAYITPEHCVGVVGHNHSDPSRPLEFASMDALYAIQDAIRRESAHR